MSVRVAAVAVAVRRGAAMAAARVATARAATPVKYHRGFAAAFYTPDSMQPYNAARYGCLITTALVKFELSRSERQARELATFIWHLARTLTKRWE